MKFQIRIERKAKQHQQNVQTPKPKYVFLDYEQFFSTPILIQLICERWLADRLKIVSTSILCNMWNHNVKLYRPKNIAFSCFQLLVQREIENNQMKSEEKCPKRSSSFIRPSIYFHRKRQQPKNWRNHIRPLRLLHFRSARRVHRPLGRGTR